MLRLLLRPQRLITPRTPESSLTNLLCPCFLYAHREEIGGPLDIYDPAKDRWSSYPATLHGDADQEPPKRSVHGLVSFPTAPSFELGHDQRPRVLALLFFGEGQGAPKELGHDGAGKFLADTYLLTASEPPASGTTEGSDAAPTFTFVPLHLQAASSSTQTPEPRGWFAYDAIATGERSLQIALHGGLNESNTRLSDAWSLHIQL
ncbi:hypothetical protein V8E36_000534 [Tilletia maclaganii]